MMPIALVVVSATMFWLTWCPLGACKFQMHHHRCNNSNSTFPARHPDAKFLMQSSQEFEPQRFSGKTKHLFPPHIEIRAILVNCPTSPPNNNGYSASRTRIVNISQSRQQDILPFQGFDQDEPLLNSEVVKCKKKLLFTIKINNLGKVHCKNEFIVVDHVYDSTSKQRSRLLNPYVFKLRQEQVTQLYGLRLINIVNAEASEEIITKQRANYTGCDDFSDNPTCGSVKYQGKPVPFSQGFCCSCDALKNAQRQPRVTPKHNRQNIAYTDSIVQRERKDPPNTKIKRRSHVNPVLTKSAQLFEDAKLPYMDPERFYEMPQSSHEAILPLLDRDFPGLNRPVRNYPAMTNFSDDLPYRKRRYPLDASNFKREDSNQQVYTQFYNEIPMEAARGTSVNSFVQGKNGIIHLIGRPPNEEGKDSDSSSIVDAVPWEAANRKGLQDDFMNAIRNEQNPNKAYPSIYQQGKIPYSNAIPRLYHDERLREKRSSHFLQAYIDKFKRRHKKNKPPTSPNTFANYLRMARQIHSDGVQARGGQNCADRSTPINVDPERYHESTHCLRFSDLWYTVYGLTEPIVEHSMLLQLFAKEDSFEGTTSWRDLTGGNMIKMGTLYKHYIDEIPTLALSYSSLTKCSQGPYNLNPATMRLLIPEPVAPGLQHLYPQLKGGPEEYLIVSPDQLTSDGDECDKLGVSYKAFVTQPDRCMKPPGTCLNNQPAHLWYRDKKAEMEGRPGCHFLKHFGRVPNDPVRCNATDEKKFLALEYQGPHSSAVDVELNADKNTIVRVGANARVTEVHIDSSCQYRTKLVIKVTNTGLASSKYRPRIVDCPLSVPAEWSHLESDFLMIPPQHQHNFRLEMNGLMPLDRFHCSIEVVNSHYELVAIRRIRIQRWDRCVCMFHCLCACVGSSNGLGCEPMSTEHYHAAGFQGQVPMAKTSPLSSNPHSSTFITVFILGWFMVVALIFGLIKAILGLFIPPVGAWGIDKIIPHPYQIKSYKEKKLRQRNVVHDDTGWPIHPDTYRRTVHALPLPCEFLLNVMFFIVYPLALLFQLIWSTCCCCCPQSQSNPSDREECFEWVNTVVYAEGSKPGEEKKRLLSNTKTKKKRTTSSMKSDKKSKDTIKTVEERSKSKRYTDADEERRDTEFVRDELKRSKSSLQQI